MRIPQLVIAAFSVVIFYFLITLRVLELKCALENRYDLFDVIIVNEIFNLLFSTFHFYIFYKAKPPLNLYSI